MFVLMAHICFFCCCSDSPFTPAAHDSTVGVLPPTTTALLLTARLPSLCRCAVCCCCRCLSNIPHCSVVVDERDGCKALLAVFLECFVHECCCCCCVAIEMWGR
ncbi:unnamed protein product [Polarella glacialis]|uniref:Secreted protein n=1 Tax=Polarella glacialis TaxID=89957 RepID=A0A813HKT1_POLGL|nr:unnamed protein product [Polarella glacialis]